MVYTVTMNPSLDYILDVPRLEPGAVNRTRAEALTAGGKGINVSTVLTNLGVENCALGFTAGFTGAEIARQLAAAGVRTDFVHAAHGLSRINVKLRADTETEINGRGSEISDDNLESLYRKFDTLTTGDVLVLAGSIPRPLPESLYGGIMARLSGRGVRFVVDATRRLLTESFPHHPFLVKPNIHELGEIFGVRLSAPGDVIPYARKLREMGAANVLVSMAGDGAVLAADDGRVYRGGAPAGTPVNSVGAGDSMVAGFLAGVLGGGKAADALCLGLCAGTASACSDTLATAERIAALRAGYGGVSVIG